MQDETQNPGADPAQETNAPDPSAANPAGEAEGLNQDAAAPDSAAASIPTDQGAGAFDPSVSMRGQDLPNPASPTDTNPAASADLSDSALHNTGVADPWGSTPPSGLIEQAGVGEVAEAPAADPWGGEVADAPADDPWGGAAPSSMVEQEEEGPPLLDEPGPDEPSATERVEPPGSGATPIEGDTSSRLIGGGGAVGEADGPGETIEDAGEAILDPPGAADIPQGFWRPPGITVQEPNNPSDPWGGAALPETAKQADAGGVAEEPASDPWGTPPPETAPTEGDASHTEATEGLLDKAVRLSNEHKAAMEAAREHARNAGDAAKAAAEDVAEAVEPRIGEAGEALENYVEDIPIVGDALGDAVVDATDVAQDALKDVGDVAYQEAYDKTFWRDVYDNAVPLGNELQEVRKDLAEAFEAGMGEAGEALENYVEDIPIVGDALEDAVDTASDVIDDTF